jgi:integrase
VRDKVTGKWKYDQKYISSKKFPKAKERYAESEVLIQAISELLKEYYVTGAKAESREINKKKITIVDAIGLALDEVKIKHEKTTYNSYNSAANQFIKWLDQAKLDDLFIQEFSNDRAKQYARHLANINSANFNNKKGKLSAIFNEIRKLDLIEANPWKSVENRKITENKHKVWLANDLRNYFNYCAAEEPFLHLANLFVFQVYVRPIELCRLKFADLELEKGIGWFEIRKGQTIRKEPGSLSHELVELLKPLKYKHSTNELVFSKNLRPGTTQIVPQRIGDLFREVRDKLKLDRAGSEFYELKHTGVSIMVARGIPMRAIQEQCRHTSIVTTEKYIRKLQVVNDQNFFNFPEVSEINY